MKKIYWLSRFKPTKQDMILLGRREQQEILMFHIYDLALNIHNIKTDNDLNNAVNAYINILKNNNVKYDEIVIHDDIYPFNTTLKNKIKKEIRNATTKHVNWCVPSINQNKLLYQYPYPPYYNLKRNNYFLFITIYVFLVLLYKHVIL